MVKFIYLSTTYTDTYGSTLPSAFTQMRRASHSLIAWPVLQADG